MLQLIFALILCFLLQKPYFEYKPDDKRFSILVWNLPEERVVTIPTDLGRLDFHTLETEIPIDSSRSAKGAISYCDYPEGTIHSDSIDFHDDFFDATVQQSASRLNGLLVYQDDYSLGKYPGRIWRIHYYDSAAVMKSRAFLVGSRLYIIQVACSKEFAIHPSIDLFLNSFRSME